MEVPFRVLPALVLCIAGLTVSHVFGAARSKMSGVVNDASDITWAHAVNSRDALDKALEGSVDFLEADISLGHVVGRENLSPMPIMAHPPDTISDISLDTWLNTVVTRKPDRGVKLDFKSLDVLESSLIILKTYSSKLNSSVWLNADVLSGPVNSPTTPVQDETFLTLCQMHFPNATLSIGWTTHWYPTFTEDTWHYGWQHVRRMADLIRCKGYDNKYPRFTFPVRGIFASRSIRQLQWLLRIIPSSTLTVWTGKYDPLQVEDLLQIRSAFPKDRVYYDVPEHINAAFNEKKNAVELPTYSFKEDGSQWMTLTKGQGTSCSALTYIKSDAIVFGKSLTTAVLQKSLIVLKGKDSLKITGKIKFFDTDEPTRAGVQELAIVLADVSLFSKNMSGDSRQELDLTSSDTEVIWSAINSSIIYTFRHKHKRGQRQSEEKSCRLFKLDTSEDKSFEVWTVPCDVTHEESSFEELVRNGIPEISSRKRLVLPRNPFMLGFVSSGEEHVAIYDLKFKGHKKAFTSGSSTLTMPLGLFLMIFSLFCKMLFDML